MRRNCWDIKGCGCGPEGPERCPASEDRFADGANGGYSAGRICWLVSGTLCDGEVQGTFAQKGVACTSCEVFQEVQNQEGEAFLVYRPFRFETTG
jgi:methyl-accepting chemotaxis protein